ncbi:MAG: hypothetical protein WC337_03655 [Candidatus Muiribacteriota bacterium]
MGIIIHSDCMLAGHGPGVATLMADDATGVLNPIIDKNANIGQMLKIGIFEKK